MSIQRLKKRFAGGFGQVILIGLIVVIGFGMVAMFSSGGGFFGGGSQSSQATPAEDNEEVAQVNGQPITRGAFEAAFTDALRQTAMQLQSLLAQNPQLAQDPQFAQYFSVGVEKLMQLRLQALQTAESNALIAQAAKQRGLSLSGREVDERLDQMTDEIVKGLQQQFKGQKSSAMEQVYAAYVSQGGGARQERMSERSFRRWYRNDLSGYRTQLETEMLMDKVRKVVAPLPSVTDAELRASYELITPREILVALRPAGKPARTEAEAKQRAEELLAKARGGADFAALAKADSDRPEAKKDGGLLPPMAAGSMDPQWLKLVASLQPGQVVGEPIKQSYGYSIVKVEKRESKLPPDFEKNKAQLRSNLASQRQQQAWSSYVQDLMVKAKLELTDPELLGYQTLLQGKSEEGVKLLEKAAETPEKMGRLGAASVFYQLASDAAAKNDWERAVQMYTRADDYVTSSDDREGRVSFTNEGSVMAEAHAQTVMGMARANENLSRAYTKQGKTKEAASSLDEALSWYQAASDAATSPSYHQQLQQTYTALGRKDLAENERTWLADYEKRQAEKRAALEAQQKAAGLQGMPSGAAGPAARPNTPAPSSAPKPASPK